MKGSIMQLNPNEEQTINNLSKVLVYTNGGSICWQTLDIRSSKMWRKFGRKHNQRYMYEGNRYWNGKIDRVIVFDVRKWDKKEFAKRDFNGFKEIECTTIDI